MKKPILVYGAIAGAIPIGTCILGFVLKGDEATHGTSAMMLGYLVMLIAFCVIFLAVKRHRDLELGGVIRFKQAFQLGLGISLIASLVYVVGWEAYLAISGLDFAGQYADAMIEAQKQAGVRGEQLETFVAEMETMKANLANPFFRLPITFTEIFPVGLLVSLIAAFTLRKPEVLPAHPDPTAATP